MPVPSSIPMLAYTFDSIVLLVHSTYYRDTYGGVVSFGITSCDLTSSRGEGGITSYILSNYIFYLARQSNQTQRYQDRGA